MKENEQLDMEEVFQLLEEENKVFTKAVSQLFLNLFEYILDIYLIHFFRWSEERRWKLCSNMLTNKILGWRGKRRS